MKIKLIVCANSKGVIGRNGNLLFHIENDLRNFKRMTTDNVVIMGRKTFESLPKQKPLPNRINIIISTSDNLNLEEYDNLFIVHSIPEALELCCAKFEDKEIFVIGGATIYNQFMAQDLVDECFVTEVDNESIQEGDAVIELPWLKNDRWKLYYESEIFPINGDDMLTYKFLVYKRKY